MPSVLITGLNGFVAVHTAIKFLSEGWNVVGTVRSASKGDATLALPALIKARDEGKISYVVVTDLASGDFSEGLKQVDAIAHCASPWHLNGESWSAYRDPAVKGTTNIIEQAAKFSNIKAVSIVSSFAAVMDIDRPFYEIDKTYTEADWLPVSEEVAENAQDDGGMVRGLWYCASKKYAELAGVETHKKLGASFSLATLNPPVINGPAYHIASADAATTGDVSTINQYNATVAGSANKVPETLYSAFIDVRDVANALYETISRHVSGRFLLSAGLYDFDTIAEITSTNYPELVKAGAVPQHLPKGQTPLSKGSYKLDSSKSIKELGLKYITLEQSTKDTVDQFIKLGAVKTA